MVRYRVCAFVLCWTGMAPSQHLDKEKLYQNCNCSARRLGHSASNPVILGLRPKEEIMFDMDWDFGSSLSGLSKVRPRLGRLFGILQVRSLNALKPGRRVLDCSRIGNSRQLIEVISEPFEKELGWWVKRRIRYDWGIYEDEISLSDNSVVPYSSGMWNCSNWLEWLPIWSFLFRK